MVNRAYLNNEASIKAQKDGVWRTSGSANTGTFGQRCGSAESTYPPCNPSTGCSSESFIITCNKLLKVSVSLSLVGQEPKEGGLWGLLIYSQLIRSTGNNLDLEPVPKVCVGVCVGGMFRLVGLSP